MCACSNLCVQSHILCCDLSMLHHAWCGLCFHTTLSNTHTMLQHKKNNTTHTGVTPNTCEQEQHATRNITHMRDLGEGLRNMEIVASGACVPHSLFIEKRGISFHSVYAISSGQRHSVFVWISHGPRLIWATTKCKLDLSENRIRLSA